MERAMLDLGRRLDILGSGRYEALREAIGDPIMKREVPKWDVEAGELSIGGQLARYVNTEKATNIRVLLNSFEHAGWPPRIATPFPPKSRRLVHTVETLNENLRFIKFAGDGTGTGVTWRGI
jgi:hypothetical protein